MRKLRILAGWMAAAAFFGGAALSLADDSAATTMIRAELASRYPGTRIDLAKVTSSASIESAATGSAISLIEEDGRGTARFRLGGVDVSVSFHAWMKAPLAVRRIRPGERLDKSLFLEREIDVSSGFAREFKGIIIPPGTDLSSLEARNTILEGAFPTVPGVVEIPDVRRGDAVRVRVLSGGLALVTRGIAQEPSYRGGQVRILASSTKMEMVGTLGADGIVEVRP